jgi:hypothetical protein
MRDVPTELWVVYQWPMKGSAVGTRAVCEQREWQAMDRAKPGYFTLIRDGIKNEGEAEQLSRGNSDACRPGNRKRFIRSWPAETISPLTGPDCSVAG